MNKFAVSVLAVLSCFIFIFCSSCVKDVNYEQIEDFKLEPDFEVSLLYFDLEASYFLDNATDDNIYSDRTIADLFSSDFFDENLDAAEFYLETTNTLEQEFFAVVTFYDEANFQLYTVDIQIPAYTGTEPVVVPTVIFFDKDQLGILKNTYEIGVELFLLDGNPELTEDSDGSIQFKSSGLFYLNFYEEE